MRSGTSRRNGSAWSIMLMHAKGMRRRMRCSTITSVCGSFSAFVDGPQSAETRTIFPSSFGRPSTKS